MPAEDTGCQQRVSASTPWQINAIDELVAELQQADKIISNLVTATSKGNERLNPALRHMELTSLAATCKKAKTALIELRSAEKADSSNADLEKYPSLAGSCSNSSGAATNEYVNLT